MIEDSGQQNQLTPSVCGCIIRVNTNIANITNRQTDK